MKFSTTYYLLLTSVLLCNRKDCTKTKGSQRATAKYSLGKIEEQRHMELAVQHLDWLMFWSDTDEIDPVWVGRAIVCSDWEGKCWYHNTSGQTIHNFGSGKISLKDGDVALNVQWYKRLGDCAVKETDVATR